MDFILKRDTFFKKESEDQLKLVRAVCNSNEFRTKGFFSAVDKTWRLDDDEKEQELLETPEGVLPRTMVVSGATPGQFVSMPVLTNLLLAEKNEQIQKLEKKLQELTEAQNLLSQSSEDPKEIQERPPEDSRDVSTNLPQTDTTESLLPKEDAVAVNEATVLLQNKEESPNATVKLEEENVQSFLIEKEAEIVSLKHEVAAIREELKEKEILLRDTLEKLEKMHKSVVQSQVTQECVDLLLVEKEKLQKTMEREMPADLISAAAAETDGTEVELKDEIDDNHENDGEAVLVGLLDNLRNQVRTLLQQDADDAPEEECKEKLASETTIAASSMTDLEEGNLGKQKKYLENMCALLIQERLHRRQHLFQSDSIRIQDMNNKQKLKGISKSDGSIAASDDSANRSIKSDKDKVPLEYFPVSLIVKELQHFLNCKETDVDIKEEQQDFVELKRVGELAQEEAQYIINELATSGIEKEKHEEEITSESTPTLVVPNDRGEEQSSTESEGRKEEGQANIEPEDVSIGDWETSNAAISTTSVEEKAVDDVLITLQQKLETCSKERDTLLQKLEKYEHAPTNHSLVQIQESSQGLQRELDSIRRERDAMHQQLRSQALKESDMVLEYNSLSNKYNTLSLNLQKISVERDDLQIKLNEYSWKDKELDRLRYRDKEAGILRIERDRMRVRLEELSGIEVAYIRLMEKVEDLQMKAAEADRLKERAEKEVLRIRQKTCDKALQVSDCIARVAFMSNKLNLASPSEDDNDFEEKLATVEQDGACLQHKIKALEEYVRGIEALCGDRHQTQNQLNKLRKEIINKSDAINEVHALKKKLELAQRLKEKASAEELKHLRLQVTKLTDENSQLRNEQMEMQETLVSQVSFLENERKCLQKKFHQFQQDMAKMFNTNLKSKLAMKSDYLQLSEMCDELQNFQCILQQLLTENSALGDTISILKETETQLKNLTIRLHEEKLLLEGKVFKLEEENASLKETLFGEQETLRGQVRECDKEITILKRSTSVFSQKAILLKNYKNRLSQLKQENMSLRYKIIALKEKEIFFKQAPYVSDEVRRLNLELNLLHKENSTLSKRMLDLSEENSTQKQLHVFANEIACLKCHIGNLEEERQTLQQRISILVEEIKFLGQTFLLPDKTKSLISQLTETNEDIVSNKNFNELEEISTMEETLPTHLQRKDQINQLIQENQALKDKLKHLEARENIIQDIIKENYSLKCSVIDKTESNTSSTEAFQHPQEFEKTNASDESIVLQNRIVQLQKELGRQKEKCKYMETELVETSNKLIECEVKLKLNTEAITGNSDASNPVMRNLEKELLEQQNARELADEILQHTQSELDKERFLTKDLQNQVSALEEELAVEKQHLEQLIKSMDTALLPESSIKSESLAEEVISETDTSKAEEDKTKLEKVVKCNKILISEIVYLKDRLKESEQSKNNALISQMQEFEILKTENLNLLNTIKKYDKQITVYDVELHKLHSEMQHLKQEVKKGRSAYKNSQTNLETEQQPEENIQGRSESLLQELEKDNVKEVSQLEVTKPCGKLFELSDIVQNVQTAIHYLSTRFSETAAKFQANEMKELEVATAKLEKVLEEQLVSGDSATMGELVMCLSETQQLEDPFRNLKDELNVIKAYSCGIDTIKTNLQQHITEISQLEAIVQKLESEIKTLRQPSLNEKEIAPSTLQELKYVIEDMRRKCPTCAEAHDHCTALLEEVSAVKHLDTSNSEIDWSNKCVKLEKELEDVRNTLSDCEKRLQKAVSEKERHKLKYLGIEKELKHWQHKYTKQDLSGRTSASTEMLKFTPRARDNANKAKGLHTLKHAGSSDGSKDIEKIEEVMQLIERMRRKCKRCAAAYEHCENLLAQAISKDGHSSNEAELAVLQQKYVKLLNEYETKAVVEEELTVERTRSQNLHKELEAMKRDLEKYKIQEHITIDKILNAERKKTEELERELCKWKKRYEDSLSLSNVQTLSGKKAKASSCRIKELKAEISQLKKELKTCKEEVVSSDILSAERQQNLNLQKELENLRKAFEEYKIQEQYYIEDMLDEEVKKTAALEEEVIAWKRKYQDCWNLLHSQASSNAQPMATIAHVRAMESEIVDLKEKLSICKMEMTSEDSEITGERIGDYEGVRNKTLEEELKKLRRRNKELTEVVEEMEVKHQSEVRELKDKIAELEMKLASVCGDQSSDFGDTLADTFQKQLREKENVYEANIKSLKATFERDIKNLKKLHDENILRLQKQHDEELQDINRLHEDELKAISVPGNGDNILQQYDILHSKWQLSKSVISQQEVTDVPEDFSLNDSITTLSSSSKSFTNILMKVVQDGIAALDFVELSHLHQEVCQATANLVLEATGANPIELDQSTEEAQDKMQLSRCISVLQMEIIKRQKEAEKKVLYFGMQMCKERKRICELRELLRHEKEENLGLKNCIGAQSQSIATLKMEKALVQRQSECIKQRLQQYIVLLKKERAKARLLEEEVSKVKSTKQKLENLLEMEKKYNETNETRQSLFIETMKVKLDTAIESEAKLRYQLHQKQSCQMAGDAGTDTQETNH